MRGVRGCRLDKKIAFALLIGIVLFSPVLYADKGSIKVKIIGLENVSDRWKGRLISVAVFIGKKMIYQTPTIKAGLEKWNKEIRIYSEHGSSITFRLIGTEEMIDKSKMGDILEEGFEEAVADWEDQKLTKDESVAKEIVCEIILKWKPQQKIHKKLCKDMMFIVEVKDMGQK